MGDAWEWDLADGSTILARLELPARIESVWLGQRLVSRSAKGGKGGECQSSCRFLLIPYEVARDSAPSMVS